MRLLAIQPCRKYYSGRSLDYATPRRHSSEAITPQSSEITPLPQSSQNKLGQHNFWLKGAGWEAPRSCIHCVALASYGFSLFVDFRGLLKCWRKVECLLKCLREVAECFQNQFTRVGFHNFNFRCFNIKIQHLKLPWISRTKRGGLSGHGALGTLTGFTSRGHFSVSQASRHEGIFRFHRLHVTRA